MNNYNIEALLQNGCQKIINRRCIFNGDTVSIENLEFFHEDVQKLTSELQKFYDNPVFCIRECVHYNSYTQTMICPLFFKFNDNDVFNEAETELQINIECDNNGNFIVHSDWEQNFVGNAMKAREKLTPILTLALLTWD